MSKHVWFVATTAVKEEREGIALCKILEIDLWALERSFISGFDFIAGAWLDFVAALTVPLFQHAHNESLIGTMAVRDVWFCGQYHLLSLFLRLFAPSTPDGLLPSTDDAMQNVPGLEDGL